MSMQDPIADMLTRIRNAQAMGILEITMPYSNVKNDMLKVLQDEGYISQFDVITNGNKKDLSVTLKYYQGRPVIDHITRVSKPSLRVYKASKDIQAVRGGFGIAILSTPKGVMSDKAARAQQVGGEV